MELKNNDLYFYSSIIKEQLNAIITNNEDYNGYTFYISDEESFIKVKDFKENSIYLVISFNDSVFNFAEQSTDFNINALGEANSIEVVRKLLNEFVITYNLTSTPIENGSVLELYSTPILDSAFNETDSNFRSIFNVEGSFVATLGVNDISELYYYNEESEEYEEIKFLSINNNITNQILPEPQGDSFGRNTITLTSQTFTLTFTTYLFNNALINKLISTNYGGENSFDINYKFRIVFENGTSFDKEFKNISFVVDKELGSPSKVNISFSLAY